jgi:hypothetical protein
LHNPAHDYPSIPFLYKRIMNLVFPTLLLSVIIIVQDDSLLALADGQQQQENASVTDMTSIRNSIIPQAVEVNKSNLELIKIGTASPNTGCDTQ